MKGRCHRSNESWGLQNASPKMKPSWSTNIDSNLHVVEHLLQLLDSLELACTMVLSLRIMLGNFNFRRPNPSGHEEHVDRNAQPVERLALPSTTLSQRLARVGMDRGDSGEFPTVDLNLSLAPAGRAAVAEGLPEMRWDGGEWSSKNNHFGLMDTKLLKNGNRQITLFVQKLDSKIRERTIGNVNESHSKKVL